MVTLVSCWSFKREKKATNQVVFPVELDSLRDGLTALFAERYWVKDICVKYEGSSEKGEIIVEEAGKEDD